LLLALAIVSIVGPLARLSHTHLLRDDQVLAWLRQTAQFVLDV
jgi:hypothetical protein